MKDQSRQLSTTQLCLNVLLLVSEEDIIKGMFLQICKISPNPKELVPLAFGRQYDVSTSKLEFLLQGHQVIVELQQDKDKLPMEIFQ